MQAIEQFVQRHSHISMSHVLDIVGQESLLLLMTLLSIFNIVLSPLPMNSFILGVPLVGLAFMYLCKIDVHSIPQKLLNKQLECVKWRPYLPRLTHYTKRAEVFIKPRWASVFFIENRVCSGLSLLLLTLIIVLPIPFANIPASLGVMGLTLGILQKDGLIYVVGHLIMLAHLVFMYAIQNTLIDMVYFA